MSRAAFLTCLLAFLVGGVTPAQGEAPPYRVIANPTNPITGVERRFLAQAFLKKATQWSDGEVIRPVDLAGDAPARRHFSEDVLERTVAAVKSYWQQVIFSGRGVPPPELDSEKAVIAYVLANKGAIGYLPAGTDPGGARVVKVR